MQPKVIKTWESVEFYLDGLNLTLDFNHETQKYTIRQPCEEGIRFDKDTIKETKTKVKLLQAVVKYIDQISNNNGNN